MRLRCWPSAAGSLRRVSAARACGVKLDRLEWLRGEADLVAGQASAGQHAPLWELVRQLAMAAQQAADGRIISRREEMLECWEGFYFAEFSEHMCALAYNAARQAVEEVIQKFTLADVQLPELK
jgi:hypothetical protein